MRRISSDSNILGPDFAFWTAQRLGAWHLELFAEHDGLVEESHLVGPVERRAAANDLSLEPLRPPGSGHHAAPLCEVGGAQVSCEPAAAEHLDEPSAHGAVFSVGARGEFAVV